MFKKLVVCVFVVAFALSLSSCKKKGDQAAKEDFGKKVSVLLDEAAEKVVKAEDAAGVAAALNEFLDAKEQLAKGCDSKAKDCDKSKSDGKCKEFDEKIKDQLEKYKDDPEVAKAVERLSECKKESK